MTSKTSSVDNERYVDRSEHLGKLKTDKLIAFKTYSSKIRVLELIKFFFFILALFIIIIGLFGTPIGIENPAILLIWIGWWLLIVLIFLPFNAKMWCAVCPIPYGSQLIHRYIPLKWLKYKHFPHNSVLLSIIPFALFLVLSVFSVPISTIPAITAFIILSLLIGATLCDYIFDERSFCKNICPINPLLSVYSRVSHVRVNSIDFMLCKTSHDKTCLLGNNSGGWGCDWGFFPGNLKTNYYKCTTCMECFQSCPMDNLRLTLSKSSILPSRNEKISYTTAFSPLFFFEIIFVYTMTKIASLSPFHSLIMINNLNDALLDAVVEGLLVFVLIPILFLLLVVIPLYFAMRHLDKGNSYLFDTIKKSTFPSIPFSLALWIAFSLTLILPTLPYLLQWLADPFRLGWNILGLGQWTHFPSELLQIIPIITQIIILGGFLGSIKLVSDFTGQIRSNSSFITITYFGQIIFYCIFLIFFDIFYFL